LTVGNWTWVCVASSQPEGFATFIKGFIAVIIAALVLNAYTFAVIMLKYKQVGVGVWVAYFTRPMFWIALVANCAYAYIITVER
jgi:hypothetical protein